MFADDVTLLQQNINQTLLEFDIYTIPDVNIKMLKLFVSVFEKININYGKLYHKKEDVLSFSVKVLW